MTSGIGMITPHDSILFMRHLTNKYLFLQKIFDIQHQYYFSDIILSFSTHVAVPYNIRAQQTIIPVF